MNQRMSSMRTERTEYLSADDLVLIEDYERLDSSDLAVIQAVVERFRKAYGLTRGEAISTVMFIRQLGNLPMVAELLGITQEAVT